MWSTPRTIKSAAASIKKFYKCMLDNNLVDESDYAIVCESIEDNMEEWQDTCYRFNNNDWDSDDPFEW